jgi:hypothetical protein
MASKDFRMNTEGGTGKGKHVTVVIVQELEIILKFDSGESHGVIMAACSKELPVRT